MQQVVFADTFYYQALLDRGDEFHVKVKALAKRLRAKVVTTTWVLTEVGNALSCGGGRILFGMLLDELYDDPNTTIISADESLWTLGISDYRKFDDKEWAVTDCISFIVMRNRGIYEALTNDHHFEQAGFQILIR